MADLGESGTVAKSPGAPPMLIEWAPVFNQVGLGNCLAFCTSHEGLLCQPPTKAGLQSAVNTLKVWIDNHAEEAAGISTIADVYATENPVDATKENERNAALAAMRYFHSLAFQQKEHTTASALAQTGMGDNEKRQEEEARRRKANAPQLAANMRKLVQEIYNLIVPPAWHADPILYVQLQQGFGRKELSALPPLSSARYGRSCPPNQEGQRVVLNDSGTLATAEDDEADVSRNAAVVMQIYRWAITMLCAGQETATPKEYPAMGQTGLIYKGKDNERQVHFGMDAYVALTNQFLYLSSQANPKGLIKMFEDVLIPRLAIKMQNGHTPGSAALEIVHNTPSLDISGAISLSGSNPGGAGKTGKRKNEKEAKTKKEGGQAKRIAELEIALKRAKAGQGGDAKTKAAAGAKGQANSEE